ncbi:MAG: outer membrane lipoprotein-sorting protein [Gammaproteobacteria bacterium]|jgi:outer membrane lipoprotein-sorting protein
MNKLIFTGLATLLAFNVVLAQTPEEQGLAIAQEVAHRDQGWDDTSASMKMVLRNKQGDESNRLIRIKVLEVSNDGDKSLTIFDNPVDVKGTAFLSFSHAVNADEQWLYLPALKRVKRISSSNKSGPFMGSQFAFEDLASFEVDKYRYKYLRDEKLDSHNTFVVENYPQYKHSGYTRQIVWIDQQRYIPLKVEYYDRKNDLLKTLELDDYKQYLNQYWRAHNQVMVNHQNSKTTVLSWNEYQFRNGLNERDFRSGSLKRAK